MQPLVKEYFGPHFTHNFKLGPSTSLKIVLEIEQLKKMILKKLIPVHERQTITIEHKVSQAPRPSLNHFCVSCPWSLATVPFKRGLPECSGGGERVPSWCVGGNHSQRTVLTVSHGNPAPP